MPLHFLLCVRLCVMIKTVRTFWSFLLHVSYHRGISYSYHRQIEFVTENRYLRFASDKLHLPYFQNAPTPEAQVPIISSSSFHWSSHEVHFRIIPWPQHFTVLKKNHLWISCSFGGNDTLRIHEFDRNGNSLRTVFTAVCSGTWMELGKSFDQSPLPISASVKKKAIPVVRKTVF